MRYFASHRANHPVGVNGRNYSFTPTLVAGGLVFGVLAAETPEDEANLAILAGRGVGVEEITKESYEAEKKRTPRSASKSSSNSARLIPAPSPSMDAQLAPSAEPERKPDPQQSVRIVSLAAAVRTSRLNPPNPMVAEKDRVKAK
jgi:hypothetical protein